MFHETYGDDLEAYALADWRRNFELQQQGKKVRYAGHLQCFCDAQKLEGISPRQIYGKDNM